jgi:Uma2 family endonuclease
MNPVLEPLLQSPRLPHLLVELNDLFAREKSVRERLHGGLDSADSLEFINGQIVSPPPVDFAHINARKHLAHLLSVHVERHGLGWAGSGIFVTLTRNDFEPDIVFYGSEKAAALKPDQLQFPAPDLVVEVLSETTEARDRGVKLEDYAAHGIREYWLLDPEREFVEQYELMGDRYTLRVKQTDGTLRSEIVPGFAIPVRAVFDRALNLQTLRRLTGPG